MKQIRYTLFFCLLLGLATNAWGQSSMTDDQIMQFIVKEHEKNASRSSIVTKLIERGVTIDRIRKIRDKYEKQKNKQVVAAKNISGITEETEGRLRQNTQARNNQRVNREFDNKYLSQDEDRYDNTTDFQRNLNKTRKKRQMERELAGVLPYDSLDTEDWLGEEEIASTSTTKAKRVFGRDIFSHNALTFEPNLNVATPDNYVLGPGDAVYIDVWGASQKQYAETLTPEGAIHIEGFGPIYLNGMTVAKANQQVRAKLGARFGGSNIKLTVGGTKSISVNVMGEVRAPGTLTLPAFSTVFHALYTVGGTNDIGTLRSIKVYRNNRLISTIDLYDYILNGNMRGNVRLVTGDVIVVEPYQCLVNITGKVKRPMFYEMKPNESVATLIAYAGGFTGDAYEETVRLIRQTGGVKSVFSLNHFERGKHQLADADSVFVDSVLDRFRNIVELKGAVMRPGKYQMDGNISTVRALIEAAGGLSEYAMSTRAVMHRRKDDRSLEVESFNVQDLLERRTPDIALRNEDIVFVPSVEDLQGKRTLSIHGEVRYPGQYAFADKMTIEDFILQAGGLTDEASLAKVDVARRVMDKNTLETSPQTAQTFTFSLKEGFVVEGEPGFQLQPYDEVFVRRAPGANGLQHAWIEGEVAFAGSYAISQKNFRLSDLVKQAGGVSKEANIQGARLIRRLHAADQLKQKQIRKIVTMDDTTDVYKVLIDADRSVGINLDKALANPGNDRWDIILQDGDHLSIPRMNNTVNITGAVMYPNIVAYKSNASLSYYINQCGGYQDQARTRRVFAIHENGTVARVRSVADIQPGTTIVVPTRKKREGVPVTQILSVTVSLATLGAVLINAFKN